MSSLNFVAGLLKRLSEAFGLVGVALRSLDDLSALLAKFGWTLGDQADITAIRATFQPVISGLDSLTRAVTALEAIDPDNDPTAFISAVEAVGAAIKTMVAAIRALEGSPVNPGDPAPFNDSIFWQTFPQQAVEYVIYQMLERRAPQLFGVLHFLGVLSDEAVAAAPGRIAYQRQGVDWGRIPAAVSRPGDVFRDVYGWGGAFADDRLLVNLEQLLAGLTLPAGRVPPPTALLDHYFDANAPSRDRLLELRGPMYWSMAESDAGLSLLQLNLIVIPIPPTGSRAADPAGFAVLPEVIGNLDNTIPLTAGLSLELHGGFQVDGGIVAEIRPEGVEIIPQPGSGTVLADFARLLASLPSPWILLGNQGSTRLELAQGHVAVEAKGPAANLEYVIGVGADHARLVIDVSEGDGFLQKILGGQAQTLDMSCSASWSNKKGLIFNGQAALEANIPVHLSLAGVVTVHTIYVAIRASAAEDAATLQVTASGEVALGPVEATIDRVGLALALEHRPSPSPPGNLGDLDLTFRFKPPDGIGVLVDAGPIVGGGYLFFDETNGRYAGVLELKLYDVTVKAIGLVDTKLPDGSPGFSFLIVITTDFPPIELGFGFTLNGVGGLAGINRTVLLEPLRAGVRAHSLNSILFPDDPVGDAPRIISDLRALFPPADGRYVFGPMFNLGWGTPTVIEAQVGIVLELPAPVRLAILGQAQAALPAEDAPLVELHLDVLGTVDFGAKKLAIDASLYDSWIVVWSVSGDAALRYDWGDDPNFVFSAGGFHPQFKQLPPGFPSLRRLTASVGLGNNPRFSLDGYFAITTNTVQFGAHAELYAAMAGFELHGFAGFDALIVLSPFGFVTELRAGVDLSFEGIDLFGVHLDLKLAGPAPWIADGSASFDILFWTISVHVHVEFGPGRPPPLPRKKVLDPLVAALADRRSWSGVLPTGAERAVSLAARPGDTTLAVHPLSALTVRQTVVPLETPITRFAGVAPDDGDTFQIAATSVNGQPEDQRDVTDLFARAQYMDLSDADKLATQPYERFPSGMALGSTSVLTGHDVPLDVRYETLYVPDPFAPPVRGPVYGLPSIIHLVLAEQGAAALSAVRLTGMAAYVPPGTASAVQVNDPHYVVASTDDLAIRYDLTAVAVTQHAAATALAAHLQLHPAEADSLQVLPTYEAVGEVAR